ncbi:hypothetical protein Zmor_001252 [Zophobas morio]|uniref:dolichol kinase n=1 Tax=Zophobas morio TaxID=2755281 RepID=A0AA38IY42_9CUCU|nr:hypothetical protein Zmor_001252 [Zophobas morio]
MFVSSHNITLFLNKHKLHTRPHAGHGLWLMFLLPAALITSAAAHPVMSSSTYKLSSIFSVGLLFSSLIFLYESSKTVRLKVTNVWLILACCIVAGLLQICLHRGLLFSFWSAIVSTVLYHSLYFSVLKNMPNCFSLGEAAICCQSYILLLYFTVINILNNIIRPATSMMQMSTLTIQVGLIGLSAIIFISYQFGIKNPLKFYILTGLIFAFVVVVPLQILLKTNPLLWILTLFWEDLQRNKVLVYWVLFSLVAVVFVNRRIKRAKKASTIGRKIFHFLIIAVFIPGLLYNCCLLYLASGVILGIFFMLEVLRVLNIPPLAEALQNGLVVFGDEKDTGIIAFTPMYLLAGCSLPLWIHPAPCDVTNSAVFNLLPLLSGVLSIGVGDTAASIVGSKFGTHHWRGSRKTVEGTVACIGSQLLAIFLFVFCDFIKLSNMDYVKTALAIIIGAITEAKTDQVDNLVLPFIMYIILIV